jgi:hypothetical protein
MKWGRGWSSGRYVTAVEGEGVQQERAKPAIKKPAALQAKKSGATGGPITGRSRVPATGKETA